MCLFPAEAKVIQTVLIQDYINTDPLHLMTTALQLPSTQAWVKFYMLTPLYTIITDRICSKCARMFEMHIIVRMVLLNISTLVSPHLFCFVVSLHQCLKHFTVTIVSPLIGVISTDLCCCFIISLSKKSETRMTASILKQDLTIPSTASPAVLSFGWTPSTTMALSASPPSPS